MKVALAIAFLIISWIMLLAGSVEAAEPSFDCYKVRADSIEGMVCKDDELALLDRKLAETYSQASQKALNEHLSTLKAEQRGWINRRNECWKNTDRRICVEESYRQRIAQLQARYRLIAETGTVRYVCDGNPANEVTATFFPTDPPTLIAERGDSISVMYLQPSASGSKYQGPNEVLWEHQGEARITWGCNGPEMRCQKAVMKPYHPLPGSIQ